MDSTPRRKRARRGRRGWELTIFLPTATAPKGWHSPMPTCRKAPPGRPRPRPDECRSSSPSFRPRGPAPAPHGPDASTTLNSAMVLCSWPRGHLQGACHAFELNRPVHAEKVGPRRGGSAAVSETWKGVACRLSPAESFPAQPPGDDSVACINLCELPNLDVLGLRFRSPQLRLEPGRIRHARQVLSRSDPLADFDHTCRTPRRIPAIR